MFSILDEVSGAIFSGLYLVRYPDPKSGEHVYEGIPVPPESYACNLYTLPVNA